MVVVVVPRWRWRRRACLWENSGTFAVFDALAGSERQCIARRTRDDVRAAHIFFHPRRRTTYVKPPSLGCDDGCGDLNPRRCFPGEKTRQFLRSGQGQ